MNRLSRWTDTSPTKRQKTSHHKDQDYQGDWNGSGIIRTLNIRTICWYFASRIRMFHDKYPRTGHQVLLCKSRWYWSISEWHFQMKVQWIILNHALLWVVFMRLHSYFSTMFEITKKCLISIFVPKWLFALKKEIENLALFFSWDFLCYFSNTMNCGLSV